MRPPFSLSSRENATQRGNSATAIAGLRRNRPSTAKAILLGDENVCRILQTSQKALECARGGEHIATIVAMIETARGNLMNARRAKSIAR